MASNLVIVESPAKASTIKKYLGKDFEVLASYGHVRDLQPKEGAVDTEHDFEMKYEVIERNSKYVDAITKAMKKADTLYLATDLDQEGELSTLAMVTLDPKEMPDLRPGSTVIAKIDCGRCSLGYVWLRELLEFLQPRVLF